MAKKSQVSKLSLVIFASPDASSAHVLGIEVRNSHGRIRALIWPLEGSSYAAPCLTYGIGSEGSISRSTRSSSDSWTGFAST